MTITHRKAFEWSIKEKDGLLKEDQRQKLRQHRLICPICQQEIALALQLSGSQPAVTPAPGFRSQAAALRKARWLKGWHSLTQTLAWGAATLLLALLLRWTVVNLAPTELTSAPQESSLQAGAPLEQPAANPAEPQKPADGAPTGSEDLWLTLGNSIWLVIYFAGVIPPLLIGLAGILLGIREAHVAWLGVLLGSLVLSAGLAFLSIDVNSGTAIPLVLAIPFIIMSMSLLALHLWETRTLWSRFTWLGIGLLFASMLAVILSPLYSDDKREVFDRTGFLVVLLIGLVPALLWRSQNLKGRWRWVFYLILVISLFAAAGTFLSFTLRSLGAANVWLVSLALGEFLYCFVAMTLASRLLEPLLFNSDRLAPMQKLLKITLLALLFVSLYAVIRSEAVRNSLREDPSIGTVFLWGAAWTAVLAAVSQAWKRKGKRLWAFAGLIVLFAILLSPAMLVPKELPYQLTEQSARRLEGAIQEYHADQGAYPASLGALVPRYLLLIPEPVTYHTQVWCYDGGKDYFRLGYYDSEKYRYGDFASLFVKEFASAGTPPEGEIPCGVGKQ
jgi:hypothetical protein